MANTFFAHSSPFLREDDVAIQDHQDSPLYNDDFNTLFEAEMDSAKTPNHRGVKHGAGMNQTLFGSDLVSPMHSINGSYVVVPTTSAAPSRQGTPLLQQHGGSSSTPFLSQTPEMLYHSQQQPPLQVTINRHSPMPPQQSSPAASMTEHVRVNSGSAFISFSSDPAAPGSERKRHRTVSGLGTPSRVAKKGRQVSSDFNTLNSIVSPSKRRSASTSLTTSQPLMRSISDSAAHSFGVYSHHQDRNVSNSSYMSGSTSWSQVPQSPNHMILYDSAAGGSMGGPPELMESTHPSPNQHNGPDTKTPPTGFVYESPMPMGLGARFEGQPMEYNGYSSMPHSQPGSTSMVSVASFPTMRTQTLDTINEHTAVDEYANMTLMLSQPIPQSASFPQMDMPSVPNMHYNNTYDYVAMMNNQHAPSQAQAIQSWTSNTQVASSNTNYGNLGFQHPAQLGYTAPPLVQRHASTSAIPSSFVPYDMVAPNGQGSFPMMPRSASTSHVPTHSSAMSSLEEMPAQGDVTGLFPFSSSGSSSHSGHQIGEFEPMSSRMGGFSTMVGPSSVSGHTSEPDTPRKRQRFPPVGNRLKPGPKPKNKTPRKVDPTRVPSPVFGSGIDPTLLNPPAQPHDLLAPSSSVLPSSSRAASIEFGPDLSEIPHHQLPPPTQQPQFKLEPPRNALHDPTADSQAQGHGLPKSFLETMYDVITHDPTSGAAGKKFKCLIDGCGRQFPRKSAITSHIQTHLEDKPHVCQEPDCGAAFVRQHDLRRHTRIHSGNKPFKCDCGKGFARGDALMRHKQRGICAGGTTGPHRH
ncbi:hypothetical protein P7C73_g1581, partial [Tremellales sp. Uapishka_1]